MIPGSRGTSSYLVANVGEASGVLAACGYSIAHGAGRKWKRSDARANLERRYHVEDLRNPPGGGRVVCDDRSLLYEEARQYAHYPGGHNEAYPDAPKNLFRNVYGFIAGERAGGDFATFVDGHHEIAICEAVLKSSRDKQPRLDPTDFPGGPNAIPDASLAQGVDQSRALRRAPRDLVGVCRVESLVEPGRVEPQATTG